MGLPERVPLTLDDYWSLPDDGQRYEILGGELNVSPSPVTNHQRAVMTLSGLLWQFVEDAALGLVLSAPMDVIFSDHDVCQPDVLFVRKERVPEIVRERIFGAPDLAIEVLSPSTARWDHVKKRRAYERFGVQEYWLVDLDARTLFRYRRDGAVFVGPEVLDDTMSVTSTLLPGFTLDLSRLFANLTD